MLSRSAIKNDIEYAIHVDHEVPMEQYTSLAPLIESLADIVERYADAEATRVERELRYKIASHLKDEVGSVVMSSVVEEQSPW